MCIADNRQQTGDNERAMRCQSKSYSYPGNDLLSNRDVDVAVDVNVDQGVNMIMIIEPLMWVSMEDRVAYG
jgi:hypothetical protein